MPRTTLEGTDLVDRGFCSDVYAWGTGCVLKLYHDWVARESVDREYRATQAVHATGLPVPAVQDLLEVNGRCGIVFERVDGISLLTYSQRRPWTLFGIIRQFADLHARIHRSVAPAGLPSLRERIGARIDASEASATDKQAAHERLSALPEGTTLCHGDFHPGNVLITAHGWVIIDWSSASCGHPIGDVACTSRLMRAASLPPWSPRYMHCLLRCFRHPMHRSYLKRYFENCPGTYQQVDEWQPSLAVAAKSWRLQNS